MYSQAHVTERCAPLALSRAWLLVIRMAEKACLGSKEGLVCRHKPRHDEIGKGSNLGCAHFKASSVCGGACASREGLEWEAEGTKWEDLWRYKTERAC